MKCLDFPIIAIFTSRITNYYNKRDWSDQEASLLWKIRKRSQKKLLLNRSYDRWLLGTVS